MDADDVDGVTGGDMPATEPVDGGHQGPGDEPDQHGLLDDPLAEHGEHAGSGGFGPHPDHDPFAEPGSLEAGGAESGGVEAGGQDAEPASPDLPSPDPSSPHPIAPPLPPSMQAHTPHAAIPDDDGSGTRLHDPIRFDVDDAGEHAMYGGAPDASGDHAGERDHGVLGEHADDDQRAVAGVDRDTDRDPDPDGDVADGVAFSQTDGLWTELLDAPTLGLTPPEVTQHSLDVLGIDQQEFQAALEHIGASDSELGLDGHTMSVALGEAGADALVEHAGVDDLAQLLAEGHRVVLTGPPSDPVLSLVDIDLAGGTCTVQTVETGEQHIVPLESLDASWAAADYQIVTATGPTDGPIQLDPLRVAVVQAAVGRWE